MFNSVYASLMYCHCGWLIWMEPVNKYFYGETVEVWTTG